MVCHNYHIKFNCKPKSVLLIIFSFLSLSIYAQLDTNYVKSYKDQLTARAYTMSEAISLEVDPLSVGPNLVYRPNSKQRYGVAGFYKWLGLGIAIQSPFPASKENIYGTSKSIDLRINAYGSWINAELAYANYKGFYLENTPKIIAGSLSNDPYYYRGDLQIESISGIVYFVPNYKKHSFKAAYIQNEYQLKSSGSLIIAPGVQINRIDADNILLPNDYSGRYNVYEEDKLVRGKFNVVGVFVGYSYTLVFLERFYVNAALLPGAFMQYYNYHTEERHYEKNNAYFLWTIRFAAGYNGKRWFAGMGGMSGFNNSLFPIKTSAYALSLEQFRIWIGTHFAIRQ